MVTNFCDRLKEPAHQRPTQCRVERWSERDSDDSVTCYLVFLFSYFLLAGVVELLG